MDDSSRYIARGLQGALEEALKDTPVVCILGPRQSGKSTLAEKQAPNRTYISLDDRNYLKTAQVDPIGFIAQLPDFVTIDEVQRVPELFLSIKRSVDANRRPGRFLLTGSTNILQLPKLADSLAGRMECLYLQPFTEVEKERAPSLFLQRWLAGKLPRGLCGTRPLSRSTLPIRLVAGGYPEPCRRSASRARQWHRQYLRSVTERDVRDVAQVKDVTDVSRLLELLAHRTATLLNTSALAGELRLDRLTVERHLSILERLFLVRRLPAWHRNSAKRLVKAPKVHFVDSGLAATLSALKSDDWNRHRSRFGHLLESFVTQQVIAQAGWTDPDLRFWHYRDKDKIEVDCVITRGSSVWGMEVKAAASVNDSDGKGLRRLAAQAGPDFQTGIVLYDGNEILPLDQPDLLAVPVSKLWEL